MRVYPAVGLPVAMLALACSDTQHSVGDSVAVVFGERGGSSTTALVGINGNYRELPELAGIELEGVGLDLAGQEVLPLNHDQPWVARTLNTAGIMLAQRGGTLHRYSAPGGGGGFVWAREDGGVEDLYRTEEELLTNTVAVTEDGRFAAFWRQPDTVVLIATGDRALVGDRDSVEHAMPEMTAGSLAFAGDFLLIHTQDPGSGAHRLWRAPRDGSREPMEIEMPPVGGTAPSWISVGNKAMDRDGSRVVLLAGDSHTQTDIVVVDVAAGRALNLTRRPRLHQNAGTYEVHDEASWENQAKLAISSSGAWVAFVLRVPFRDHETFYGDQLYIVPADGSSDPVAVDVPVYDLYGELHLTVQNLVFLGDDQLLFGAGPGFRSMDLFSLDVPSGELSDLTGHASSGERDLLFAMQAGWRLQSQQLVYLEKTAHHSIRVADPSTGEITTVADRLEVAERRHGNHFARCGSKVYFAARSGEAKANEQLWVFDLDNPRPATRITDLTPTEGGGEIRIPVIATSSDCDVVAFQCGSIDGPPYGADGVCVLDQTTSAGPRRVVLPDPVTRLRGPLFVAGDSEIVFAGEAASGSYAVYAARVNGSEPARLLFNTRSSMFDFIRGR